MATPGSIGVASQQTPARTFRRVIAELAWVVTPKVASGALTLIVNIALLRHLGPAEFGVLSMCLTGILLTEAVIGSPFDMAVLRQAPLHLGDGSGGDVAVERAALLGKLALSLTISAALLISTGWLTGSWSFNREIAQLIPLACLAAVALLTCRSALVHLQVRRRFRAYGIIDLVQLGIKFGGVGLLLLLSWPAANRILLFHVAGPLIASLLGFVIFCRPLFLTRPSAQVRRSAHRQVSALVVWFLLTIALGAVMGRLDILLLGWLGSADEVGILAGAQIFATIPELLGTYLAIVIQPRIMSRWRAGVFLPFFLKLQGALALMAVIAYLSLLLGWDWVMAAVLPPAYRKSAEVLFWLLPGTLLSLIAIPLALQFVLFIRPKFILVMDCIVLPLLLAGYWSLIPQYGALGAAWTTCGLYIVRSGLVLAMAWYWGRKPPETVDSIDKCPKPV